MYNYLINLLLLFFSLHAAAQLHPVARYSAMGNTGTALQGLESLSSNQAGIAGLSSASAAVYYHTYAQYRDVRNMGLLAVIPSAWGVLGLQVSRYDMRATYQETTVGLSYAKAFGHHLFAALSVNYHGLAIIPDLKGTAYTVDLGLQYQIRPKWWLGAYVANPLSAAYHYSSYAVIPVKMRLGTSYRLHEGLLLTADIERVLYKQLTDIRTGMEYKANPWLNLRGGLGLNNFSQFFGAGLSYRKMMLDLAATVHPQLGFSPQMLFAYVF